MIRVKLTVEANLRGWSDEIKRDLAARNTDGMRRANDLFKRELRAAIQGAGLGRRLGFAVGSELYPKAGNSLSPAGVIRPRGKSAENILRSYTDGARIRGKGYATGSSWLAIPVRENLPVLGRSVKPTPDLVSKRLYGKSDGLRWVQPPRGRGRYALLVADTVTRGKTGKRVTGFGRNRAIGQRRSGKGESLVMFILVPEVNVRRRVDVDAIARRVLDQLPRLIASART